MPDNNPRATSNDYDLQPVLKLIAEIARPPGNGYFAYRGETQQYSEVSSGLYQSHREEFNEENFDIQIVQDEILKEAKQFIAETDDFEILTQTNTTATRLNLLTSSTLPQISTSHSNSPATIS